MLARHDLAMISQKGESWEGVIRGESSRWRLSRTVPRLANDEALMQEDIEADELVLLNTSLEVTQDFMRDVPTDRKVVWKPLDVTGHCGCFLLSHIVWFSGEGVSKQMTSEASTFFFRKVWRTLRLEDNHAVFF